MNNNDDELTRNPNKSEIILISEKNEQRYRKAQIKFRRCFSQGIQALEEARIELNVMVQIQHEEHPDWSIRKISYQIWIENEGLPGFSESTVKRELDDSNRTLLQNFGHSGERRKSQDKDTEDSSTIQDLQAKLEQASKTIIELQEQLKTPQQEEEEEPTPTIEVHKANEEEEDEQVKQFKLESDVDKYKKIAFDKQQQIEELEIKLERITNQVNTQAETMKQQQQAATSQTEDVISREGIYILGEKSIPSIFKEFKTGKNIGIPDQSKINPQRLQQLEQLATKMVN